VISKLIEKNVKEQNATFRGKLDVGDGKVKALRVIPRFLAQLAG
jgi:hypothetical protein